MSFNQDWFRKGDEEYRPLEAEVAMPPKKPKAKALTKLNRLSSSLTDMAGEIWAMHDEGRGPTDIAKELCIRKGKPPEFWTGRQVSNWINYHRKAKKHKTLPVSLKNNNLEANPGDCLLN